MTIGSGGLAKTPHATHHDEQTGDRCAKGRLRDRLDSRLDRGRYSRHGGREALEVQCAACEVDGEQIVGVGRIIRIQIHVCRRCEGEAESIGRIGRS